MLMFYLHDLCVPRACLILIPGKGPKSHGPGTDSVINTCKPPLGFWEPKLGPLKEEQGPLTTEPPLQPTPVFIE